MEGINYERKSITGLTGRTFGFLSFQPVMHVEQVTPTGSLGIITLANRPRKVDKFQAIQDNVTGLFYYMAGMDRLGDPLHPLAPGGPL